MTDLTGQRFEKLTVISLDLKRSNSKRKYWLCQCDCGNIKSIRSDSWGKTKSCGCLTKEQAKINIQKAIQVKEKKYKIKNKPKKIKMNAHAKNLTNQIFGELTVIKRLPSDKQGVRWLCQCSCGNTKIAYSYNLIHNKTKSCGCIKSYKEKEIESFLKENNISYIKEYCFLDLKDKKHLRFDFAIVENNTIKHLIEYNGEQHYKNNSGWYSENIVKHDQMKINYCKQNGYNLIILDKNNYDLNELLQMLKNNKGELNG